MAKKREQIKEHLYCPYCDAEIVEATLLYCKACKVAIFHCPKCGRPVSRDKKKCPHCGADIKVEAAKES
jgi:predicted amidophosphoribosyltransferase